MVWLKIHAPFKRQPEGAVCFDKIFPCKQLKAGRSTSLELMELVLFSPQTTSRLSYLMDDDFIGIFFFLYSIFLNS